MPPSKVAKPITGSATRKSYPNSFPMPPRRCITLVSRQSSPTGSGRVLTPIQLFDLPRGLTNSQRPPAMQCRRPPSAMTV
jgi:hypothetical protein